MPLSDGKKNVLYKVSKIETKEEGFKELLFTLGCYAGEDIIIISRLVSNLIIHIKGSRYSIDNELAKAIIVT